MTGIKEPHVQLKEKQQTDGVRGDKHVEANPRSAGKKTDASRLLTGRTDAHERDEGVVELDMRHK